MADTLYTRALARALEMHGSTQSLAHELRVPENTLKRWLSGRAQMPLQAFHRTIALLTEHERANSAELPAAPMTERVAFALDGVAARCEKCGGCDFVSAVPRDALRMTSRLECSSCRAATTYGELAGALATLAVKHARMKYKRPAPARTIAAQPTARPPDST